MTTSYYERGIGEGVSNIDCENKLRIFVSILGNFDGKIGRQVVTTHKWNLFKECGSS